MNKLPTSRHENASQITTEHFVHPHPLKTAVLFLVFNRPDTTKQVFKAIRQAKPPRLYVAADGPRVDKPGEEEKVEQTRRIAIHVDWDCEVKTLFRVKNLGCKYAVSGAIDWFFKNEEEGIILEDDCLPSQSFFWFCEELLERYREDMRIMAVSGDNFQKDPARNEFSYYFSRFNHCWGWASWRRAWSYYEKDMQSWPHIRDNDYMQDILLDKTAVKYWGKIFEAVYKNKIDTWDYQWTFSCWVQNGLTVLPNVNLVSNIGFGIENTHTPDSKDNRANIPREEMLFPLIHPPFIICDKVADNFTETRQFTTQPLYKKILRRIIKEIGL